MIIGNDDDNKDDGDDDVDSNIFTPHLTFTASGKPYEVRFKIKNMNVEELLMGRRWDLYNVIKNDLWNKSAHDLTMTSLVSATQRGDRLPASPDEKEGSVFVSLLFLLYYLKTQL